MKDPNGDVSVSKNYRAICISSLILKIFDHCLLIVGGHLLSNNSSQFDFQENFSTVQCTWVVQETISYFLQNDSDVFSCLLDFSKAFDLVNFEKTIQKIN